MNIGRPLLTATQCRQWPDPQHGRGWEERRTYVHRLFEEEVECTPNILVVEDETCQQTYDQVNRRANRWARHLVDRGFCPGARIALLAEQPGDLLTAMLAIWKAGKALTPLNLRATPWQIAQILDNSGAAFVLTTDKFTPLLLQALDPLPRSNRTPFFYLEEFDQLAQAQCNLPNLCLPSDLAYTAFHAVTLETMWRVAADHITLAHCLSMLHNNHDLASYHLNGLIPGEDGGCSHWRQFALLLLTGQLPALNPGGVFEHFRN